MATYRDEDGIEVEERDLLAFLTGDGLIQEERNAQMASRQSSANFLRSLAAGNPTALYSPLRARTISVSGAHGFLYVRDQAYYDAVDEVLEKDPNIEPAIDLVTSMIYRNGWDLQAADEKNKRAMELRDEIEQNVLNIDNQAFGFGHLLQWLPMGKLMHGLSVHEIVWQARNGLIVPQAYPHRHPGQFSFASLGEMYIIDSKTSKEVEAPPFKYTSYRFAGKYGNPYGRSIIEALKIVYEVGRIAITAWPMYAQTFGSPVAVGGLREGTAEDAIPKLLEQLKVIIKSLGQSHGVVLRPEHILDFKPRDGGKSGETVHERIMNWCARTTLRIIFGSTLQMMEAEHGSRAQSVTHDDIGKIKMRPYGKTISEIIQRDVIRPYIVLNHGEKDLEFAPNFWIDVDEAIDVETAIKALEAANKMRIPGSKKQARQWLGVQAPDDDDDAIEVVDWSLNNPPQLPNPAPKFRESRRQRRGVSFAEANDIEEETQAIIDKIAAATSRDVRTKFFAEFERCVKRTAEVLKKYRTDTAITNAAAALWSPGLIDCEEETELALRASRMVSAYGVYLQKKAAVGDMKAEFADDIDVPDNFSDAVQWMINREIMSKSQLNDLVSALVTELDWPTDASQMEQLIRTDVLAIARTANVQVAERINNMLAAAVQNGTTVADFLEAADELVEQGLIPGGSDSYLEMVYRTETATAYTREQDAVLGDPDVDQFLWGYEIFNPRDERSRPTHGAMDGVRIKKGSAADLASRPGPPWAYSCRCGRAPLIHADGPNAPYTETPNALSLVSQIERF